MKANWRAENFATLTEVKGQGTLVQFPTLSAFFECAQTPIEPDTEFRKSVGQSYASQNYDMSFTQTRDFAHAAQLAKDGWPEGFAAIEAAKAKMEIETEDYRQQIKKPRLRPVRSVAGQAPDIGRFLKGHPLDMINYKRAPKQTHSKVIDLVINTSTSGGVKSQNMINRGAAIAAAVELLEAAGYSCAITMTQVITGGGKRLAMTTPLKLAGQALDRVQLAYCTAHPSFLRRHIFAAEERLPDTLVKKLGTYSSYGSYGMPAGFTPLDCKSAGMSENTLMAFAGTQNDPCWNSVESAAAAAMTAVKKHLDKLREKQQAPAAA